MKKALHIIAAISRVLFFIGLVLWAGQLRIGSNCIGGHFVAMTHSAWDWSVDKVTSTETFSHLKSSPYFPSWLGAKKERPSPKLPDNGEKITAADRDSLIKLLP